MRVTGLSSANQNRDCAAYVMLSNNVFYFQWVDHRIWQRVYGPGSFKSRDSNKHDTLFGWSCHFSGSGEIQTCYRMESILQYSHCLAGHCTRLR